MTRLRRCVVLVSIAFLTACAGLPPLDGRTASVAQTDTAGTRLGRAVATLRAGHPHETGVHALAAGPDAFAARVRLLLDDNNIGGLDETLATLDAHALIEVRLYNPVKHRGLRLLNYATDFSRINRRMHNKSFTVDSQASIVGARNIGNEYFDTYWNSASAYPARPLVGGALPGAEARLKSRFAQTRAAPESVDFIDALRTDPFVADLMKGTLALEWAQATLVADDPAKTLADEVNRDQLLLPSLLRTAGAPAREFDLVSPYLVLGEQGTAAVVATAAAWCGSSAARRVSCATTPSRAHRPGGGWA